MAGKKILIAEDDPVSLKLVRDVLQANGYETKEVTSGEEAVVKAVQSKPDLIVMDIRLPGIDGLEATRRLKSDPSTEEIPIIAVTAHAMPEDEARILEAGCQAYLSKPLRFAEFISVVNGLLSGTEVA
ncbi:MAG: response regulator [Chloroflexi bacterium]|nr:response regulator [Chloroflexota bacterium]